MLAMHLLQSSLVLVNTLIIQQILSEPQWAGRLTDRDKKALTALIWAHINPYGTFHIDMNTHPPQPRTRRSTRGSRLSCRPPTRISRRYLAAADTDPSTGPSTPAHPRTRRRDRCPAGRSPPSGWAPPRSSCQPTTVSSASRCANARGGLIEDRRRGASADDVREAAATVIYALDDMRHHEVRRSRPTHSSGPAPTLCTKPSMRSSSRSPCASEYTSCG
jgi:hypothetical protein